MFIWYILTYCLILNRRALKMVFDWIVIPFVLFLVVDLSSRLLQHEWLAAWLWIMFSSIWMREICELMSELGYCETWCGRVLWILLPCFLFVLEYRSVYNHFW